MIGDAYGLISPLYVKCSYISQAWKEEHLNSTDDSSEAVLSEMEYIEAMVRRCEMNQFLCFFLDNLNLC